MTCIIGYQTPTEALMAADTMIVNESDEIRSLSDHKIKTIRGDYLVGMSGAVAACEEFLTIIEESSALIEGRDRKKAISRLNVSLANHIRESHYFKDNTIPPSAKQFSAIVALPYGLFTYSKDQPVLISAEPGRAVAIGSSREYALGAMAMARGRSDIDIVLRDAIMAVKTICPYTGGDIDLKKCAIR